MENNGFVTHTDLLSRFLITGLFWLGPASPFPLPLFPIMKAVTVQAGEVPKSMWTIGSVLLNFFPNISWGMRDKTSDDAYGMFLCALLALLAVPLSCFNFSILIWCVSQHLFICETAFSPISNRSMNSERLSLLCRKYTAGRGNSFLESWKLQAFRLNWAALRAGSFPHDKNGDLLWCIRLRVCPAGTLSPAVASHKQEPRE